MASALNLNSLSEALVEIMNPAAAAAGGRTVTVAQVHVAQSGPLLAVLRESYSDCHVRNLGRLASMASLDGFLQATLAIIKGVLPELLADPDPDPDPAACRPAVSLLDDYAQYVKEKAATVGGTFQKYAIRLCGDLIRQALTARRRPLRAKEVVKMRQSVEAFRSRQLTLRLTDDADLVDDDLGLDPVDEEDEDDQLTAPRVTIRSFREMATALIQSPVITERITVASLRVSDAPALLAIIRFHSCRGVSNLRRVCYFNQIDSLLRAIQKGLLDILASNPSSGDALGLLAIYAHSIQIKAGKVGGSFEKDAGQLCNQLIGYAHAGAPLCSEEVRGPLGIFRSQTFALSVESDSD